MVLRIELTDICASSFSIPLTDIKLPNKSFCARNWGSLFVLSAIY